MLSNASPKETDAKRGTESKMQPSRSCLRDEKPKKIQAEVFSSVFFFFFLWRTSLKCTLLHRHADLQGVGRGVTEPDIKQKLGQVRGARRGRQERACGREPCVGTNLTCPPPPHLQSYLLTHALSFIPTPPLSSPLFSLHCIHHPLPTLQTPCGDRE